MDVDTARRYAELGVQEYWLVDPTAASVEVIDLKTHVGLVEDPVRSVVRLCFAKADATLDAGIERLARARKLF